MIGCLIPDVKDVSELAPILLVPQLLFAGIYSLVLSLSCFVL